MHELYDNGGTQRTGADAHLRSLGGISDPGANTSTSTLTITAPAGRGNAVATVSSTGFLAGMFISQMACGGGTGSNNVVSPAPTNYTVTVTGTSGAIKHTTQVTVTVQ